MTTDLHSHSDGLVAADDDIARNSTATGSGRCCPRRRTGTGGGTRAQIEAQIDGAWRVVGVYERNTVCSSGSHVPCPMQSTTRTSPT